MPDRVLSKGERENITASNLVAADVKHVNDEIWNPADVAFIRTAAEHRSRAGPRQRCDKKRTLPSREQE